MRRSIVARVSIAVLIAGAAMPLTPGVAAETTASAPHPIQAGTYTLVTGDRVAVGTTPDGRLQVTVLAARPDAGPFQVLASGTHLYVLPHNAAGFIGRSLSLDLFDVTGLTPDGSATTVSQPPLTVEYEHGSAGHLPPGLSASDNGHVTVSDPGAFGQALDTAWAATKRGDPPATLAGIARIMRAGATTTSPPPGELHTITVKAFDRRGQRATGDLGVVANADDANLFLAGQSFYLGEFAFSVPAGHYSISSYISTVYPDGGHDFTLAVAPEVTVNRDVTVVLDARKGQPVSAATPLPSTPVHAEMNYQRDTTNGPSFTSSFVTFDATSLYAMPTSPVQIGGMHFYPYFRLAGGGSGEREHLYDLQFHYPDAIPADLARTVTHGELATIEASYHSPLPGRAQLEARFGLSPWQAVTVGATDELVAPLERTEYVTARPELIWLQLVAADPQSLAGVAQGNVRSYEPGARAQARWLAQPMPSGVRQEPIVGQPCPMCRTGNSLTTMLMPFTDSDGHFTLTDPATTEDLALYQNGMEVGRSRSGFASFPMSPDPAMYTMVYDVRKEAAWWPTTTRVRTEWTFPSQARPPDPLPKGWTCGGKGGGGRGDDIGESVNRDGDGCSFEPLLFARYRTSAGIDDVIPAGTAASVAVTVSHQRGSAGAAIGSLAAEVSYDDGQSWRQVSVTPEGGGLFRLDYLQPDLSQTNGYASLRVQASDVAGSSIEQTIVRAYPLTVTPPAQPATQSGRSAWPACSAPSAPPFTHCMTMVDASVGVSENDPVGLEPADIQAAYDLPPSAGQDRTVAIVAAYDNPNAEADLAVYRSHYGLPPCTTANGCFRKANQRGESTNLPSPDPGWALEISLDLDAVSAACPACKILLVEADSASLADLITAAHTAERLGADVISNSYGTVGEFSGEQYYERHYRDIRVPLVVASGNYGYGNGAILVGGVSYPAASQFAVAVGGTSLTQAATERGWSETAWDGATSGCSAYIHKPGWQKDELCGKRTVADVAAVADPGTGLAVYDSFAVGGWVRLGGTSLAAPIVASVFAMAEDVPTPGYTADLYQHADMLNDVVGGANGTNCSSTYLCTAVAGYDGPTGLGTPAGPDAFRR